MVIWTRWGILGLLIPTVLIVIAIGGAEAVAKQRAIRALSAERKAVKQTQNDTDDAETPPPEEDPEEVKATELKRVAARAQERAKATKRANDVGYLIGGLVSAVVLWPLGRWMNKSETRTLADLQSGELVQAQFGGGHTMFFIPLEYWGFIWAVIGMVKCLK
ncbi:hypothetical protein VT84_35305 [Gemmata sp. SH-PL17]|uniref:hypothetical protein n=1 Tax=Gemmata sp. SH-PL17 TaxID=1630693 RepID=UPI0004AF89FF|nr:hypothetical protein [Gemmata sp. SH-PL17]AMV29716.1 hypothetical protein VT84_35305 [Gemmata sp. SH-PL17]